MQLVDNGLRYLEHYEFGLVREALIERETLSVIAPSILAHRILAERPLLETVRRI